MNPNTKNIAPGPERHRNEDCGAQECMKATPENPLSTIARMEARQSLLHENLQCVVRMSDNRAEQVESLTVRVHELARERQDIAFAVGSALDRLRISSAHVGGDAGSITMLTKEVIKRRDNVTDTAHGLLRFLDKQGFTPEQVLQSAGLTRDELARIMEAITIGLNTLIKIAEGSREGAPHFPESKEGLTDWLGELHKSAAADEATKINGGETVYWCPACKRHVHPENLKTFYPDVPSYTGNGYYHDACGTGVEIRRQFSGPKRPADFVGWMTDTGTRLQKAGVEPDFVRGYNFLAAYERGETPESVVESIARP